MPKSLLLAVLSAIFLVCTHFANIHAQQELCGTIPTEEDYNRIAESRQLQSFIGASQSDTTIRIPIQAHIFRSSNGTGGYTVRELDAAINKLNELYTPANLEFFQCDDVNYFDSDDHLDFNRSEAEEICNTLDVPNVVNIYFANRVYYFDNDGEAVFLCGYAYFSGPDRVVMNNSCSNNGSTLAHELGHYLQLFHTHDSRAGDELVSGANCDVAGDLLCDTPADPRLGSSNVNSSCEYIGDEQDPVGDYYSPDPSNIMSYSRKSCRDFFSPMQYEVVRNAAEGFRSYLQCPDFADIEADLRAVNVELCKGESTTFQSISKGIIESYSWEFPGGDPATSTEEEPTVTYAATGSFSVKLIIANREYADTVLYENYISIEEMNIELDTIGSATFCEGESVTFKVGDAARTIWKINDEISYASSIEVSTADTIDVRQISALGCRDRDTIITHVLSKPEMDTLIGENEVKLGESYTYTTSDGYEDYFWTVNGGTILNENGNTIDVEWVDSKDAEICVSVVNSDGCQSEYTCEGISFVTDVDETVERSAIFIYPNPAEDVIAISVKDPGNVEIYNLNGILINELQVKAGPNYQSLTSLSAGLYFLIYTSEEGTVFTIRFIKI